MQSAMSTTAKRVNNREILSSVHQAMRLLTSALEALCVDPDPDNYHAETRSWEPLVARCATPPAISSPRAPARYVVFDFETNGLGKTSNIRVCQVGATALTGNFDVIDHFSHFVNPLAKLDKQAANVNGLDADFVAQFDSWETVGMNFMMWIDLMRNADQEHNPITMLAHNGKRFDARILVAENVRHGIEMPRNLHHADSIDVMKTLFPDQNSYSLGHVYRDIIGCELPDAHDAMADVAGVIKVLQRGYTGALKTAIAKHQESFNHITKRALKVT